MNEILSKKIKDEIMVRGLSISAFEKKAGLGRGVVWSIISNKSKNPKKNTIESIAKEMGCSIEDLLSNDPIIKKTKSPAENIIYWDSKMFMECVDVVDSIFSELNIDSNADTVLRASETLYEFSVRVGKVDERFAKFIINKMQR